MIRITSRKEGFRRCGIAHPAAPAIYPDDHFTDEELARLVAEPMLVVECDVQAPLPPAEPEAVSLDEQRVTEESAKPRKSKG